MIRKRIKECLMCKSKFVVDFKDAEGLRQFITDKGKIHPRRMSGCCAKHQRVVAAAVKRARHAAILPFKAE